MASDLSSNCTDSLSKFDDEREEGEISLEDVSSSEEGQPANSKSRLCDQYRCDHCASTKQCTPWCPGAYHPSTLYKSHNKKDIACGKENRQLSRDSGNLGGKHAFSTLQEKNDDLVPISSDSDLEIVCHDNGLDACKNQKRSRKRKRKRKAYRDPESSTNVILNDDSTDEVAPPFVQPKLIAKHELPRLRKDEPLLRVRELSPRRHKSVSRLRKKRPSTSSSTTVRKIPRRVPREVDAENYNYRLLKKVKRNEDGKSQKTTQTEKQKGLSLKDKLQNMLNKESDHSKDKENMDNKGDTDDEDVVRLRQLALQTKPTQEEVAKVTTSSNDGEEEDDEDSEALKLRLIALKSAIQKKYQRKDKKLKNNKQTRPDSPLDNFLDPQTPQRIDKENQKQLEEKNSLEDMDLDTDIEREKEKGEDGDSPYSPSDNLSLERELLGIDPSDVCCMENKSTSPRESSIYYDDNSSPYCPSEPISNSCDFSPSSPTSSFHLSNDFDSDRDVLSPADSLLNSTFEIQPTPLVKQNEVHTLPLSPPPAPPQICTITNFLCASFVDEIEKDLDGSPLVSIEQVYPSEIEQSSLCDNQLSLLNLIPTQPVNDPVLKCIEPIEKSSISRPKSLKKKRNASGLNDPKTRVNLKPVPMTSIPQAPQDIPTQETIPIKPIANDQPVNPPIKVAQEKGQEVSRKRERKGDTSDEPTIKVAKQSDSKTQNPLAEVPQRRVSADEDELMLREMLIASLGKRKADLQPGHSKVIIPEPKKNEKPAPEPVPASTKVLSNAQVPISEKRTIVKPTKEVLSTTGVTTAENAIAKKRTDLVNPNRFVTKKPVRSTVFPSLAMSNVVNKVNKAVPGPPVKKVNLQKMSVTFNAQSSINPAMRKVNIKDNSSMLSPLNDLSEFVIKVSEDSASDFSEEESSTDKIERPPLQIPKSEFEKRIDTFLKEVRMNSENNKTKKPARTVVKTKKVPETAISTPAAVRHLSASKQEEYRRLKQQILEREKKLQKTSIAPTQSASKVNQKLVPTKTSTPVSKPTPLTKIKTALKPNISEAKTVISRPNQSVVTAPKEVTATSFTIGNKSVEVVEEPEKPQDQTEKLTSVENEAEKETKDATSSEATLQNAKSNDEKEARISDNVVTQVLEESVKQEIKPPCEDVQIREKEESLKDVPDVETTIVKSTVDKSKIVDVEVMNRSLEITSEKAQNKLDFKTTTVPEERIKEDKRGGILKVLSIPELNSRLEHNQCDISPPLRTEPEVEDDKSENDSVIIVEDSENTQSHDSAAQSDISNAGLLTTCKSEIAPRNDRREIHRELQQMASLPSKEQQEQLLNMEKDLVSTRYSFLDDLTKLEQVYIQWQKEKEEQQNLSKEIKELRLKLKLAEQKLQEQKTRLSEINVTAATCHDKVNHGRDEYNKLSRVCNGLGHRLHGANYKIPAAGAPLVSNKLKVVAAYSEKFNSSKGDKNVKEKTEKKPSNVINLFAKKDQTDSATPQAESQSDQIVEPRTTDLSNRLSANDTDTIQKDRVHNSSKESETTPRPYESCLSHLKDTRSTAVDGILCPFELRGTCNDTECAFVHHPKKC